MSISNSQVVSWTASLSLRGGSSAEMTLSEGDGTLASTSTLGETYELHADIDGVSQAVFRGIVSDISVDMSANDPSYKYSVSLQSFAASLARKPINTETFGTTAVPVTGENMLNSVAQKYGAMSSLDFDFSSCSGTDFSHVTLVGDSMISVFKDVANASECDLFVDHDGKLKTALHTTSASAVALSNSDIISISKGITNLDGFSCIRVRGRYKSLDETGPSLWHNQNISFVTSSATSTFSTTIATQATPQEIRAATWDTDESDVSAYITNITDGGVISVRFTKSGSAWPAASTISFNVQGTGPVNWLVERQSISLQTIQNVKPRAEMAGYSHIDNSSQRQGFVNWAWRSQKEADAKEESRIDLVGFCTGLISEFGMRWFEVDNAYVPSITKAQNLGCRKIQEFLMSREVFELSMSWDGSVTLNDAVSFTDPFSDTTVTGVVTAIEISWSQDNVDFNANLTVEIFDSTTCASCSYDT